MVLGTQGMLILSPEMIHSSRQVFYILGPCPAWELLEEQSLGLACPPPAESQQLIHFLGDQRLLVVSQEAPTQVQPNPTPGNVH